jgi:hypothetical protein
VAQLMLDDLGVDVLPQQGGGEGVPQSVKGEPPHYAEGGTTLCGLVGGGDKWEIADAGVEVSCRNCRRVSAKHSG